MRVIDWPLAMLGEIGVVAPIASGGLVLAVSPNEHDEVGVLAESVTRT